MRFHPDGPEFRNRVWSGWSVFGASGADSVLLAGRLGVSWCWLTAVVRVVLKKNRGRPTRKSKF